MKEEQVSEEFLKVICPEDPQPPYSHPPPKPRPPPKIGMQNVSSPPVVPVTEFVNNPSYGCTQGKVNDDDSNVYEAIDVRRSDVQEEYGREYERV